MRAVNTCCSSSRCNKTSLSNSNNDDHASINSQCIIRRNMSSNLLTLICNANCPANTANPGASKYTNFRALGSRNRSECGICGSTPQKVPENGKPPFGHLDSSGNSTGDPTPRSLNQTPEPDLGFKGLDGGFSN